MINLHPKDQGKSKQNNAANLNTSRKYWVFRRIPSKISVTCVELGIIILLLLYLLAVQFWATWNYLLSTGCFKKMDAISNSYLLKLGPTFETPCSLI